MCWGEAGLTIDDPCLSDSSMEAKKVISDVQEGNDTIVKVRHDGEHTSVLMSAPKVRRIVEIFDTRERQARCKARPPLQG